MMIKEKKKEDKEKKEEDKTKEEEDKTKEEEEKKRRDKALKEYSQLVNYPGMNVTMQPITETDEEVFGNLFNESHVIYQNNIKRYLFCSTFFILYAIIGYMYYYFIYSN